VPFSIALRSNRPGSRSADALFAAAVAIACAFVVWSAVSIVGAPIGRAAQEALFTLLAAGLVWGGLVHLGCRAGRLRRTCPDPAPSLSERAVTVLVPSYREGATVIRQTLLSAGLQEHRDLRVVLLIDDDPRPADPDAAALLHAAVQTVHDLDRWFATVSSKVGGAREEFLDRIWSAPADIAVERRLLAARFEAAAAWLRELATTEAVGGTHTDRFVADHVLRTRSRHFSAHAAQLVDGSTRVAIADLQRGYDLLLATFSASVTMFERKRWANLPHDANKAMNLNAYLSLIGRSWAVELPADGGGGGGAPHLVERPPSDADYTVPAADFVVTLDADSVLLPGYVATLVAFLDAPGNERVAVAQTPYSAFPGASTALERVAGATTDVQYLVHQGFTHVGATFWVGANAVLRRSALDDIAEPVPGTPTWRYVQDRTVIEDTESSVDLRLRGWQLHNHPARLSYSATPPDFGSLVIQRRRWANGGLIIAGKLFRLARQRRVGRAELVVRAHYLLSIAVGNIALPVALLGPVEAPTAAMLLPLSAAAYGWSYMQDLVSSGYRRRDLVPVAALNLLLVPVNLGGVVKSLQQAITGQRMPFARTPKVADRTRAPTLYLAAESLAVVVLLGGAWWEGSAGRWVNAATSAVAGVLLAWAVTRFIGWRLLFADVFGVDASPSRSRRSRRKLSGRVPAALVADIDLTALPVRDADVSITGAVRSVQRL
jgi:cellulose synthase (UDP-forming)